MPRRRTGRKRGRPRKANAKRNFTTRIGRRLGVDGTDRGTVQLRTKKRAVGHGREDLELSPVSVLLARGHLDRVQFDCLGHITETLRQSHAAVPGINVGALWSAIAAAATRVAYRGPSVGALGLAAANIHRLSWILARVDGSKALIVELAEDRCPPIIVRAFRDQLTTDDWVTLEALRRDLDAVSIGPRKSVYRE